VGTELPVDVASGSGGRPAAGRAGDAARTDPGQAAAALYQAHAVGLIRLAVLRHGRLTLLPGAVDSVDTAW
jgi:hypothetical protein